jgi:hypothetical protein
VINETKKIGGERESREANKNEASGLHRALPFQIGARMDRRNIDSSVGKDMDETARPRSTT